jgi:hypothetical protein
MQKGAQGFQGRLLPGGDKVVEFFAAAELVAVAAALGDFEHEVALQAIVGQALLGAHGGGRSHA